MSEKSPDAFRTIGEVAADLDLPQHVLRFWETKFSQIRPTKRSSGRRFYRPQDVELVQTIRDLLYGQGYTIRGVQKLLKEQGIHGPAAAIATREPTQILARPDAVSHDQDVVLSRPNTISLADITDPVQTLAGLAKELRECAVFLKVARDM